MKRVDRARPTVPLQGILFGTVVVPWFVAGGLVTESFAADIPPDTIEEVTVTATKRTVRAADYDAMLSVVDEATLRQQLVYSIDDLSKTTGGLVFRPRGNRAYDNITLRGQSSIDFYEPKVQVYIDGFVQDQATYGLLLPDGLKQVEVLSGPQGTLYGRGAIGGVIDVVTATPAESPRARIRYSHGNLLDNYSLSLATSFADGWSADIAGVRQENEGEYQRMGTGERLGDRDDTVYRGRLHYSSPDSRWQFGLQYTGANVDSSEEQYVLEAMLDNRVALPVENHYELESDHYGLTLGYRFDDVTLTSLTGYQDRDLDRVLFDTYSPESQRALTQEIRITSNADEQRTWLYTAGLYYEEVDFTFERPAFGMVSQQDIESRAAFAEVTWRLTPALSTTLGLRYEERDVKALGEAGGFTVTGSDDFSAVSPKLTVGYNLTDDARVYAVYGTGYKPGGFTRLVTPVIASFSYDAEEIESFEIGYKQAFLENRAAFSAAAYWMENDDFQLYVGAMPNQYLQNIGAAESKGLELNFDLAITEAFSTRLTYAWNDAELSDYADPTSPGVDFTGNQLPHAPEHTLNLTLAYEMLLPADLGRLVSSVHANYTGDMYFDERNTVGEDAVTLYDLRILWAFSEQYSASLNATNLLDEDYLVYGYTSATGDAYQLGQGRSVWLSLQAEF